MGTYFKKGSWNFLCDRCGFKLKAESAVKEWTGLMVCKGCYEPRNPQDFLRVPKEDTSTPWTRPEPTNTYTAVVQLIFTEGGLELFTEANTILQTEG